MKGKLLPWHEAVEEPERYTSNPNCWPFVRVGWLWRNPAGKVQYWFVQDITSGKRPSGDNYPPGAVFMAVYVPDLDWKGPDA